MVPGPFHSSNLHFNCSYSNQSSFQADIIIWDLEKMSESKRFILHKVKVEALAFSPNGCYLLSLGGQDDGR
jgi:WD40 repeat protein